jgi:membrane fusion protein (multidrug efflux system)
LPQRTQDLDELSRAGQADPIAHQESGLDSPKGRPLQKNDSDVPRQERVEADVEPPAVQAEEAGSDDRGEGDKKLSVWDTLWKHSIAVGVAAVILIASVILGTLCYLHARHFESTDDAFIDGRPVSISPEVTGNIVGVRVNDNQIVHAGDLLIEIDERDYRANVRQAIAQIAQARATAANYTAQIKSQYATIEQTSKQGTEAQAALNYSKNQDARAQDLVKSGAGTVQTAQQAAADVQSKQAAFAAATASLVAAQRQIDVLEAQVQTANGQIEQAEAQKQMADANLSRTNLHATVEGRVTRLTAAVGAVATPAQTLMVLVPFDLWVTANFKESQLADMKIGQPVDISVDSLGKTFHGRVDSLQAGSGTAFSLLPAENATGNYVKVVQRVPVKITFDQIPEVELGPGMSVVPTVTVR